MQGGFIVFQAPDIFQVFSLITTPASLGNIVGSKAAPNLKLGIHIPEIIYIPVFIRITENKIKRSFKLFYK